MMFGVDWKLTKSRHSKSHSGSNFWVEWRMRWRFSEMAFFSGFGKETKHGNILRYYGPRVWRENSFPVPIKVGHGQSVLLSVERNISEKRNQPDSPSTLLVLLFLTLPTRNIMNLYSALAGWMMVRPFSGKWCSLSRWIVNSSTLDDFGRAKLDQIMVDVGLHLMGLEIRMIMMKAWFRLWGFYPWNFLSLKLLTEWVLGWSCLPLI